MSTKKNSGKSTQPKVLAEVLVTSTTATVVPHAKKSHIFPIKKHSNRELWEDVGIERDGGKARRYNSD